MDARYTGCCNKNQGLPNPTVLYGLQHLKKEAAPQGSLLLLVLNGSSVSQRPAQKLRDEDIRFLCKYLEGDTELEGLDLRNNLLTDIACGYLGSMLEKNKSLKRIYLGGNDFGPQGAERLSASLQLNDGLVELHLQGAKIGRAGGLHIAAALQVNTSIQRMDLTDTHLDIDVFIAICAVLHLNSSVRHLVLDRPLCKGEGQCAVHVSKMLLANRSLESLSLRNLGLDDHGFFLIFEALKQNNCLKHLDLSFNSVTRDSVKHITNVLCTPLNTTLLSLNLNHNKLEDEGASNLGKAFKQRPPSLTFIGLASNNVRGNGMVDLAEMLSSVPSITSCSLWANPALITTTSNPAATQALKQTIVQRGDSLTLDVRTYDVDGAVCFAEL